MKKTLLLLSLICASWVSVAQVGRQQATSLAMDLVDNSQLDSVNIYSQPVLQHGSYYDLGMGDSVFIPFSTYWMYFIDEKPNCYWGHDCRYIFINSEDGATMTVNHNWPPYAFATSMDPISIAIETPNYLGQAASSPQTIVPSKNQNDGKYALLIAGDDPQMGSIVTSMFWSNISHSYCALLEHGYKKENIYVFAGNGTASSNQFNSLDLDGQGDDDILKVVCNPSNIQAAIRSIKRRIQPSDVLYVGLCCHGSSEPNNVVNFQLWQNEHISDANLINMLSEIDCSQIIFNVHSCFSGGIADDVASLNTTAKKSLTTSTSGDRDYRHTPLFVQSTGLDEYSFLTISYLRECYPTLGAPWTPSYTIGNNTQFPLLFGKPEIDFDTVQLIGNQNGSHELGEDIAFAAQYDNQFGQYGTKLYDCGFEEDLLTLCGIGGDVNASQSVNGNFHIENELNVNADALTVGQGSALYLFDASLNVRPQGEIILSDNVLIVAKTGHCTINFDGNMILGSNVVFRAEEGASLEIIFNPNQDLNLLNATFENCTLATPQRNISIAGCTFIDTPLNAAISGTGRNSCSATINNCTFLAHKQSPDYAIRLTRYNTFSINNCTISADDAENSFATGVGVYYCGNNNATGIKRINHNHISNCSDAGLVFYNTTGQITLNEIDHNRIGVKLLNNSNVTRMSGQCSATSNTQTQYIHDNDLHEIYITDSSLPTEFSYNVISHSGNTYWIKHEANVVYPNPNTDNLDAIDFSYNYWGNGFTPSTQLYTNSGRTFEVSPTWNMGECTAITDTRNAMLFQADSLIAIAEIEAAQALYHQVVEDYPESTAANAALKSMLAIETDYETLQRYYLFDNTIQSCNDLAYASSSLANKCDENMYNYENAIAWYENRITDPTTSYNDSIFARIDLMELQMQLCNKGEYIPQKLYQMVPATRHLADDIEQSLLFTIPNTGNQGQAVYATQDDLYPGVENLEAIFDAEKDAVALTWNLPKILPMEMRLSWASLEVSDYIGPGYQHQLAHRFDTIDIHPFIGWRIKDISIYGPYDDGYVDYSQDTVSVMVWLADKNGDTWETEEIYRSKLPDFIHYQLYTIALDTNIYIQGDRELWIGYEFMPPIPIGGGWPFAIDTYTTLQYKGNISRIGFGFESWLDWNADYTDGKNYWISSTIENPRNGGSKKIGSSVSMPEITGFRVYRNNILIADMPYPVQTYYIDENPGREISIEYCVTLLYDDGTESEPVCTTVEYTNVTANENDNAISVFPNPTHGLIHIDGTDILEVKVYDNMGRILNTYLNTNEIDLSELPDGVYTLRIIGENGHLVKNVVKYK